MTLFIRLPIICQHTPDLRRHDTSTAADPLVATDSDTTRRRHTRECRLPMLLIDVA